VHFVSNLVRTATVAFYSPEFDHCVTVCSHNGTCVCVCVCVCNVCVCVCNVCVCVCV